MKKTSQVIELRPSLTECVRDSPEQELKGISSNHSFQGTPHKLLALTARKQPFTLNGWEHSRQRSSKSLLKTNRTKQFSIGCHSISSNASRSLNPQPKRIMLRTLQPKSTKQVTDLNFKCGPSERHATISARGNTSNSERVKCGESMSFRQQLQKQKVGLLQFYQNQRVMRRLMIEMAEPQKSINIIEYPLQMISPRPSSKGKRKIATYRRYFN